MRDIMLWMAASKGEPDQVHKFLHDGLDIEMKAGSTACSPLMVAMKEQHMEVVYLLLSHDADVNTVDNAGQTPLHVAAFNGAVDGVHKLIDKGAHFNAKDNMGRTPLHIAMGPRTEAATPHAQRSRVRKCV